MSRSWRYYPTPPYHPDERWFRSTVMRDRYYLVTPESAGDFVLFMSTYDIKAFVERAEGEVVRVWRRTTVRTKEHMISPGYERIKPIDNPRQPPDPFRWVGVEG